MNDKKDTRYPYTYAADYVRMTARRSDGELFSRSEAAAVRRTIAAAIGMDDAELAAKMADYYIAHEQEIENAAVARLLAIAERARGE